MEGTTLVALGDFVARKAANMRTNAAYGGDRGDGGASRLEELWAAYKAGAYGDPPESVHGLQMTVREFNRENDPEFATYERLKQKFG